ncbi:MAG: hypothetical protein QOD95_3704, partial [Gammaproteobacteria bacterium]|nr:hypothetical protein [Gammaproteobacteria bacterium]
DDARTDYRKIKDAGEQRLGHEFRHSILTPSKPSRDEDDPAGLSHCAQLDVRRYALRCPAACLEYCAAALSGVKIKHAQNHAKLPDSQLPERGSAPFAGSLVRRLPVALEYRA